MRVRFLHACVLSTNCVLARLMDQGRRPKQRIGDGLWLRVHARVGVRVRVRVRVHECVRACACRNAGMHSHVVDANISARV